MHNSRLPHTWEDLAQFLLCLVVLVFTILIGSAMLSFLTALTRSIDQSTLAHERMMKDHLDGLKELERLRQERLTPR